MAPAAALRDHEGMADTYTRPTGARLTILTFAVATGMLLAALDASIVGTAMPTVVASLGGLELFAWVFAGYALVSTTAMPIFGRLSDVYGRKRLYLFGLGLFVFASVLCGAAEDMTQLVVFRAFQGVGGAAIFALTFAIIGDLYPPERRGYVSGVTSSMWAIASIIGPALGALLTETVGWRWVFLVNLPVSVLPIVSLTILLREPPRPPARARVDVAGAATLSGAIVLVLLAAQWGGKTVPWVSVQMALLLAAVGGLIGLFVRIQGRATMPTIPLDLFRERMFVLGTIASFAFGWAAFTLTAFVPMFVQGVIGGGARAAGVAVLAQSLAWSVAAAGGGPLVRPLGYRRMNLLGFGLMLLGYGGLLRVGPGDRLAEVVAPMVVLGLGCGFCSTALLLAMQNSVEPSYLGVATSLAMFFRNVGLAVGVSTLGALQVARLAERFGGAVPDTSGLLLGGTTDPALRAALSGSVHDAWLGAVLFLVVGLAAASRMTAWQVAGPAHRPAAGAVGE
jgi:EmrB/QacA subfamily drug resistance transporter